MGTFFNVDIFQKTTAVRAIAVVAHGGEVVEGAVEEDEDAVVRGVFCLDTVDGELQGGVVGDVDVTVEGKEALEGEKVDEMILYNFQNLCGIYFSIFTGSHRMGGLESDLLDRHLKDHKTC